MTKKSTESTDAPNPTRDSDLPKEKKPTVFLSYCQSDRTSPERVGQLVDWLREDEYDVYYDLRENPSKTNWNADIKREIESRDVLLIMLGPRYKQYFVNGPELNINPQTGRRPGAGVDLEAAAIEARLELRDQRIPTVLLLSEGHSLEECCPSVLTGRSTLTLPSRHSSRNYKKLREYLNSAVHWNRDLKNRSWYHPVRLYVQFSDWMNENRKRFLFRSQLAWKTPPQYD